MKSDTECRQMLRRLVEYRSQRRVCEMFEIDEDLLHELLNDGTPWPPGMIDGVLAAMARYDDQAPPVETDQATTSCDAGGSDAPPVSEAADRKKTDAPGRAHPAATVAASNPAPVIVDRQTQLDYIVANIYAQCERTNQILARNDASDHDELQRLKRQHLEHVRFTMKAKIESEAEAQVLAWAGMAASRAVRKIDESMRTQERSPDGWWQRLKNWLRS